MQFVLLLKDTDCYHTLLCLQLHALQRARIEPMWHMLWNETASGLHEPHCGMVPLPRHCLSVKHELTDAINSHQHLWLLYTVVVKLNWISSFLCTCFQDQQLWLLFCGTVKWTEGGQAQQGVWQGAFQRLAIHGKTLFLTFSGGTRYTRGGFFFKYIEHADRYLHNQAYRLSTGCVT